MAQYRYHSLFTILCSYFVSIFCFVGTTWLQEIVWLLINNNTSGEEYRSSIWNRVPLVEQHTPGQPPAIDLVEQMSSPRLFKSHLPTWAFEEQLTHSKCRAIVIMRNPKDSLVSFYHMANNTSPYLPITWNFIFERFRQGKMFYGDWFDYVEGWSKMAVRDNVLLLKYEDMKADMTSSIQTICTFLGVTPDDEVVRSVVERTKLKNMQKNPYTNMENNASFPGMKNFIRKGEVGGWVEYFTPEQNEYMDNLIATRLKRTGLQFKYFNSNSPQL